MVLVYLNTDHGVIKSALEVVTYGKKIGEVVALTTGSLDESKLAVLGQYGASKVIIDSTTKADDPQQITNLVAKVAEQIGAKTIVFSNDLIAKAVAPRLSVKLKAGLIAGAVEMLAADGTCKVNVFSGKAMGKVKVNSERKIITLLPNSIQPEITGADCAVEKIDGGVDASRIKVLETKIPEGEIPLSEAELVVSAGRGLKGPENWGMVEELAKTLGAATACSRPVADIGWRPDHEHVGQTGVAIRPNLYIAAGISGAIQHLAGVNGSKVIVVINTDPEAPFFKAADYGVVGDAFEVLPKLNEAIKKFKASNN
ncbi:MAG: electron transfer flavoprotein subunit alpha/FixB family protein [Bacteroidetes bacterium]|nr:electron transfer flavoprotein subunit alpha/FixB family protein [Bacteroidota bacterium]